MDDPGSSKAIRTSWTRALSAVGGAPIGFLLAYLLAGVVYTWPLAITLTSKIPHDPIDPLLNTWILWWNTQAVPLSAAWWSPPVFFPATGTLAFSEHLLGLTPLTTPLQWAGASALTAYNVAFLLSFPASAFTAYLLSLRLTEHKPASFLAGLYFGFAPYKASQLAHLQMLCVYALPLVLLALHAYLATRQRRWLVLLGISWLLLASTCGYYLFYAAVLIALWLVWFGLSAVARPAALRLSAVLLLSTVPLVPVLWGYYTIQSGYGFTRDREQIESYSADVADVLAAPGLSLWSSVLPAAELERALFPGVSVLVAALLVAGLRTRRHAATGASWRWSLRLAAAATVASGFAAIAAVRPMTLNLGFADVSLTRPHKPLAVTCVLLLASACLAPPVRRAFKTASVPAFYFAGAAVTACLSLGPEAQAGGFRFWYRAPYAWLMALPGWNGLRVPTRFWMLTSLCLGVLLAVAVSRLASRWPASRRSIYGVAASLVLMDIAIRPMPLVDPPPPLDLSGEAPGAVVAERPMGDYTVDAAALYRMIQHRRPIVNGYSGHSPPHYRLIEHFEKQGDRDTLAHLRLERPILSVRDGRPASIVPAAPVRNGIDEATVPCADGSSPAAATLRRLRVHVRDPGASADVTQALEDGVLVSGWQSGDRQTAGASLEVLVEEAAPICAVQLELGARPLHYPRRLEVIAGGLTQADPARSVWSGPTGFLALTGATRCERTAPIVLRLPSVSTNRLLLQLREDEPTTPWWIAEISVWAARPGGSCPDPLIQR